MSKKRASPDAMGNETDSLNSVSPLPDPASDIFHANDDAKRVKMIVSRDTTLQDLPMELVECILVKAVAMEVMEMKMAKSVWKDKADLVMNRLGAVSQQWSNILSTDFFRNELHRTLDRTAPEKFRVEMVRQAALLFDVYCVRALNDEIYVHCKSEADGCDVINMYDCDNMAAVRESVGLRGIQTRSIVTCEVSNCLYVLMRNPNHTFSVQRVSRCDDDGHLSLTKISQLMSNLKMKPCPVMSVHTDGSILLSRPHMTDTAIINVYNASGYLKHKINLPTVNSYFRSVFPKSTESLVLVSEDPALKTKLIEIESGGAVVRSHQSALTALRRTCSVNADGCRTLIFESLERIELLDSEFNLLRISGLKLRDGALLTYDDLQYNKKRDEVVTLTKRPTSLFGALTFFRVTKE